MPAAPIPRRSVLGWALAPWGVGAAAHAPGLRWGYFDRFAPLSAVAPDKQSARGVMVTLVDQACRQAGLLATHHAYPWRRAQSLVARGEIDGFCTTMTPAREAYAEFGRETLLTQRFLAFHRRGDARFAGVRTQEDLQTLRIGAYRGSGYVDMHLDALSLHYDTTPESLLRRVALDDLDAFVGPELTTWHDVLRLRLPDQITATPLPFLPAGAFKLALRRTLPNAQTLLDRLDRGVRELHRSGQVDAALAPYRATPR
jgi:ABC-type amino acid transport substrate-binding protein